MTAAAKLAPRDPLPQNRATSAFERQVARALSRHVASDAQLVVATSGGPDSTALLVASVRTRGVAGGVVAAYFDHGMRPALETRGDRALVRKLASTLGATARSGAAPASVPLRGEAAAREARYRWLASVSAAVGATACATGHTLDDQAETVLLRLTRGAGLGGAAGMSEVAAWPVSDLAQREPAPLVVRPLLGVTRDDVLDYLDALALRAREDETNALLSFDRNRVRHRVLVELRQINPRVAEQLARFATHARNDDRALMDWAARELATHVTFEGPVARVPRAELTGLPIAVSSRLLRLAARRIGLRLERAHVDQLLTLARQRGARVTLSAGEARTTDTWLELCASVPSPANGNTRPS